MRGWALFLFWSGVAWCHVLCSHGLAAEPASLVLRGGKVVTLDDGRPTATALAVLGDRISAVGSDADIARHIGDATKIRLVSRICV